VGTLLILIYSGTAYASYFAFTRHLQLWDISWLYLVITITSFHAIFNRFVKEFFQKQQIKKQFEHYLAPAMVKKLQKKGFKKPLLTAYVPEYDPDNDPVVIAISRRQKRENVLKRLDQDRTYQTLPAGSCSLKACFIAEGKADFFMRLGVTGEWDTGASQCIVSEAGGLIRSVDFEPMSYNERESLENPNFVITGDQTVDWEGLVNYYVDDQP